MKNTIGRPVLPASVSAFVVIIVAATASAALPGTTRESAASGVKDARILRRNFGPFAGLVITGRTTTADLYMLYLADGNADRVVLISYRPPTVVRTGTEPAATWQRFLDSIH